MRFPIRRLRVPALVLGTWLLCGSVEAQLSTSWIRQFGSSDFDETSGVSATADSVYVVGDTRGTLPGQKKVNPDADALDAFLIKYDPNGNTTWIRQFGSGGLNAWGSGVSATADG